MPDLTGPQVLYAVTALLFQCVLVVHFALRRWQFPLAVRYGPIVYGLALPAALVSVMLVVRGADWWLWAGGFLYLVWGAFGYMVEYVLRITDWRSHMRGAVFGPYVLLYLITCMFYWWPLARVWPPLWYAAAVLFAAGTVLNAASHRSGTSP